MTVSNQETRSESALGSRVDDTSSEVKLCDRLSDQTDIAYRWYVYIVRVWMKLILKFVDKDCKMIFEMKGNTVDNVIKDYQIEIFDLE